VYSAVVRPMVRRKTTRSIAVAMPTSPEGWLGEIARGYLDAAGAIPFGPMAGVDIHDGDLFHLAPAVCLKFRGIKATKRALKRATEAALSSYVASRDREPEVFGKPHLAFTFCYLAAHFGMDLVSQGEVATLMDYVEEHEEQLMSAIGQLPDR